MDNTEKKVTIVEGQDMDSVSKLQTRVKVSHLKTVDEEFSLAQIDQLIQNQKQMKINLNNGLKNADAEIVRLALLRSEIEKALQ